MMTQPPGGDKLSLVARPMPRSSGTLCLGDEVLDGIRVHRAGRHLPDMPAGPVVRLPGGELFSVAGAPGRAWRSTDNGRQWQPVPLLDDRPDTTPSHTGALLCSAEGTIVLGFPNAAARHWTWDDTLRDAPGARLPTCVMRSIDGGRTWHHLQTLHEHWTGATRDIIQLRDGRIVLTSMRMQHNPGRHSVLCYASDDDGVTWQASNVMDLGGNGHHDGVTEGSILELTDGRLLQYMRTNWGGLWRAFSHDGGLTWHPYGPAGIPASSTPPLLKRLHDGRVLLLWNRPVPEGQDEYPPQGGDGIWSATPTSNFRAELSMSLSEDDCASWCPPVVIARSDLQARRPEVCYPYAFEVEPGQLWIAAHRWNLRMELVVDDVFGACR